MIVFSVQMSFLISHVPPAHSFFQKKSILIKSDTKFSSTYFFHAYLVMCKKLVASVDRFDKVVPLTEFLGEDNLSGKPLLVRFVNRSLDVISF